MDVAFGDRKARRLFSFPGKSEDGVCLRLELDVLKGTFGFPGLKARPGSLLLERVGKPKQLYQPILCSWGRDRERPLTELAHILAFGPR